MGVEDHAASREGCTVRVKEHSRVVGYEVTADATGLTGRARLGLVAATAKAIGLAAALLEAAGGGGPALGQGGLGQASAEDA